MNCVENNNQLICSEQINLYFILAYSVSLENGDILQGGLCDARKRFGSEEPLMTGNQHVWKSQQASKHIILYHLIR